jgi:hypothetical protein
MTSEIQTGFTGAPLNTAPDLPDIRDRIYQPALLPLDSSITLDWASPSETGQVLNQGQEGACVGFSIAAAVNRLRRRRDPAAPLVSSRMLYEMARKFDEWPGEDYSGSSIRGGIRGFWHNGVCLGESWPYDESDKHGDLSSDRSLQARDIALGAYYRLRRELTDYHSALNETGIICATAHVHDGWMDAGEGRITRTGERTGGHAFAIVGYDSHGFWIQNSWGVEWGNSGFAHWTYDDWAANVMDAWVFRLAVPAPSAFAVRGGIVGGAADTSEGTVSRAPRRIEIAGHFVHVDDGIFATSGNYHSSENDVRETAALLKARAEKYPHLLFYAHGGLNSTKASATRIEAMKRVYKANGIYPYHFMYDTGLAEELKDIIFGRAEKSEARVGAFSDWTDKLIENATRKLGTLIWDEMKRDAETAFDVGGAGHRTAEIFGAALDGADIKVHLVGHSTGAILHGYFLQALDSIRAWNTPISSCTLLASAATVEFYKEHYKERLGQSGTGAMVGIPELQNYCLTDTLERDDTVTPLYRKSLLYLVSNAFERAPQKPIFGMQKFNRDIAHPNLVTHYTRIDDQAMTRSRTHGGFDNDVSTMNNVLRTILGHDPAVPFMESDLNF